MSATKAALRDSSRNADKVERLHFKAASAEKLVKSLKRVSVLLEDMSDMTAQLKNVVYDPCNEREVDRKVQPPLLVSSSS